MATTHITELLFALCDLLRNSQANQPGSKLQRSWRKQRGKAYLNLLLENLVVLLLLVEHVLLLRLLQGSFINLPPVHLLQLLTLLKGKQ